MFPDHLLDLAEWDALDEETIRRAELVEGVLVVAPSPLAEYAEAGVPHYGLVEIGPPVTPTEFVLRGAAYERVADHRARADLALGAVVDLDALL